MCNRIDRISRESFSPLAALVLLTGFAIITPQIRAQATATASPTLAQCFELTWARQPEARSEDRRREAVLAEQAAASRWTARPLSLDVRTRTDHLISGRGAREAEIGITVTLWLPSERSRSLELAYAELKATNSRLLLAKLRTAAVVRDAWWSFQRTESEQAIAQDRLLSTRTLAADVSRRVRAGDLSRADEHQAAGAVAQAEAALAEATGNRSTALAMLRGITGRADLEPRQQDGDIRETALAAESIASATTSGHASLVDTLDRADVARQTAALAEVQSAANPELMLSMARSRLDAADRFEPTYGIALRIPLGTDPRAGSRQVGALASMQETQAQIEIEHSRIKADIDAAWARVDTARTRLAAADQRHRLAQDSLIFYSKSFSLGETDLPTRLRIELDAGEARRQQVRARIDAAAALSSLRQALGLLPQ